MGDRDAEAYALAKASQGGSDQRSDPSEADQQAVVGVLPVNVLCNSIVKGVRSECIGLSTPRF